ncbi:hypothetical protein KBD71_03215 [Candidatus Woesebacteria bacterium]|nr:hypothetical protein [Candidatus Woesebacteria bacterium]
MSEDLRFQDHVSLVSLGLQNGSPASGVWRRVGNTYVCDEGGRRVTVSSVTKKRPFSTFLQVLSFRELGATADTQFQIELNGEVREVFRRDGLVDGKIRELMVSLSLALRPKRS